MTDPGPLFAPITIGGVTVRNRIVHGAMSTKFVRAGIVQPEFSRYHERRAAGGAGLIVTEAMAVDPSCADATRILLTDPRNGDGLAETARRVRAEGGEILGQLWHNGNARHNGRSIEASGLSSRPDDLSLTVARVMDESELDALVEAFAEGAAVLQKAGFAGVELAAAHGFLLHQSLSPVFNGRDDRYGGSRSGRTELTRRIIGRIRALCGPDGFIVGLKMPCEDGVDRSIDAREAAAICRILAEETPPDYFCFSAGSHSRALEMHLPAMSEDELGFRRHLPRLRAAVGDIPMLAVGKILRVEDAEGIVARGEADAVVMARGLLADPEIPAKVRDGRRHEIVPCIACNLCWTAINRGRTITCAVDPEPLAAPPRLARRGAAVPVEVVGSGVAAMETAWRLAAAGYETRLRTHGGPLGGAVALLAPLVAGGELTRYLDSLEARLERFGVARVDGRQTDGSPWVQATGATMSRPPGVGNARSLRDLLRSPDIGGIGGRRAVLYDNDHTEGTYLAARHLAARFDELVVLTPRPALATDAGLINAQKVHRCAELSDWRTVPFAEAAGWDGGTVLWRNVYSGRLGQIEAVDLFTYATPRQQISLGSQSRKPAATVGDALAPRDIMAAVRDAAELAACWPSRP